MHGAVPSQKICRDGLSLLDRLRLSFRYPRLGPISSLSWLPQLSLLGSLFQGWRWRAGKSILFPSTSQYLLAPTTAQSVFRLGCMVFSRASRPSTSLVTSPPHSLPIRLLLPNMPQSPHFRGGEVILVAEDDDQRSSPVSQTEQKLRNLRRARQLGNDDQLPSLIDLTLNEEKAEDSARHIKALEDELEDELRIIGAGPVPIRNPDVPKRRQHGSYRYKGFLIKPGTVVEVEKRPPSEYFWQFLRVETIYTNGRGTTMLRGTRLTRQKYLHGMLSSLKNEVCALLDVDEEDPRPPHLQAACELQITDVIRTRVLSQTNAMFPKHRFCPSQYKTDAEVEDKAGLVQRWTFIRYWATHRAMISRKSYSGAFMRFQSRDISDENLKVPDNTLRNEFRGGVVRGGSSKDGKVAIPTLSLDGKEADIPDTIVREMGSGQKYTVDDMFCGAGGASRGIKQAGFKLALACDLDPNACESYAANSFTAELRREDIFDLVKSLREANCTQHADVLHISPPCQFFSPAHTQPGQNDKANIEALDACAQVLERRRPRLSTGEQTFGLLHAQHEEYFFALIRQYTNLGYSFRWKLMHFKDYGIASTRKRLVWIAACPGEALPDFPLPTHSATDQNLLPEVTLGKVLASVSPNQPLHNVAEMMVLASQSSKFPQSPYDADKTLVDTITTCGSLKPHPSGERNFTIREQAALQSFPVRHKFVGSRTAIVKQIGNAFPPRVVKAIYIHLRRWLLKQDRIKEVALKNSNVIDLDEIPTRHNLIVIDDSSSESELGPIVIEGDDNEDCPMLTLDSDDDDVDAHDTLSRESSSTLVGSDDDVMMIDGNDAADFSQNDSLVIGEEDDLMIVEDAHDFKTVRASRDITERRRVPPGDRI
ncbi:S-adenosyl-L-methionine-dependent methyltransferase [Xylariaceae sp. FL1272]|nr:S-adenosyl-L-methionine-dependent methyltransferase [Xylariaceae sp. FL1272]